MASLTDSQRDDLYRECCLAVSQAGPERESLYLARLVLLLVEELGDAQRAGASIRAALEDLPRPGPSGAPGS